MLISGDPERITCIEDFPDGSLIGTASLRRQAHGYWRSKINEEMNQLICI